MGACSFGTREYGKTAQEAFDKAVEDARHRYGNDGYTGTVAEKSTFTVIPFEDQEELPRSLLAMWAETLQRDQAECVKRRAAGYSTGDWERRIARMGGLLEATATGRNARAQEYADWLLIEQGDPRVEDKWGPAGCIELVSEKKDTREFYFFGWASE